jgi:hypothetical protein
LRSDVIEWEPLTHGRPVSSRIPPEATLPDKPTWYGRLDAAIAELKALPYPWVDRATLEHLLGVGRRRAQQILQPCVTHTVGANGLADREGVIQRLQELAAGEAATYEQRRRQKVAREIGRLRQAWLDQPRVLVEAPTSVINQSFADLAGVTIAPGRIVVDFDTPHAALEKLLALAMAIGNNFEEFERKAQR